MIFVSVAQILPPNFVPALKTDQNDMPKVTYIAFDGTQRDTEVDGGCTVMEGAIRADIPGIDADCGGACACATCMVLVDQTWIDRIEPASDMELAMLEMAEKDQPNSRLSCQIIMSDHLHGLIVRTPERQE